MASRAQRESAQVKMGVTGHPRRSSPSKLCQKALAPTPTMGMRESRDERRARRVSRRQPWTAFRNLNAETSAPPSAEYSTAYSRRAQVPSKRRAFSSKSAERVDEL